MARHRVKLMDRARFYLYAPLVRPSLPPELCRPQHEVVVPPLRVELDSPLRRSALRLMLQLCWLAGCFCCCFYSCFYVAVRYSLLLLFLQESRPTRPSGVQLSVSWASVHPHPSDDCWLIGCCFLLFLLLFMCFF